MDVEGKEVGVRLFLHYLFVQTDFYVYENIPWWEHGQKEVKQEVESSQI